MSDGAYRISKKLCHLHVEKESYVGKHKAVRCDIFL